MKQFWLITGMLVLTACGPQAFVPSSSSSEQTPAGGMNVPPKVDIVLGMSSNGTMRNILPGITSELPAFLEKLQNSGWDYRFVSIPLSEYHPTTNLPIVKAVSVSKYDTNYPIGTWLAPYPGADHINAPKIAGSLFAPYFNVSELDPTDFADGHESGFTNELNFLNRQDVQSQFLRQDAMLAVITLSNGDDRSDWKWGPENTTDLGAPTVSQEQYAAYFHRIKPSAQQLRYYSLVAHLARTCRGGGSWSGLRYEEMTDLLGGAKSDICNTSVSASLDAVKSDLSSVKLSFRKHYLLIGNPPNVGTIQITKYLGGKGSGQILSQDPTHGWTYVGPVTAKTYLIDSPVPMNLVNPGDGYLIELHGDARLEGDDTADVNYQNAGTVSAH